MANIFTHCYLPFLGITSYTEKEEEETEEIPEESLTAGELIKILQKFDPNMKVSWQKVDEIISMNYDRVEWDKVGEIIKITRYRN